MHNDTDGKKIIYDIVKKIESFRSLYKDEKLYKDIANNFRLNGNEDISNLDKDHVWVQRKYVGYTLLINNLQNYLYGVSYLCNKTGSIGFTFQYKSYIIKPFLVINHNWKQSYLNDFAEMKNKTFVYKCENCSTTGYRNIGEKFIITDYSKIFLNCSEIIIKDIIE